MKVTKFPSSKTVATLVNYGFLELTNTLLEMLTKEVITDVYQVIPAILSKADNINSCRGSQHRTLGPVTYQEGEDHDLKPSLVVKVIAPKAVLVSLLIT